MTTNFSKKTVAPSFLLVPYTQLLSNLVDNLHYQILYWGYNHYYCSFYSCDCYSTHYTNFMFIHAIAL